ncbi:ABC transporter ATP-binding protein [Pilimelia columellifera subsp. columellifera]|uniref:ABC transporter ATP-binding protein n=1 Tax=Pilimelia columellifera subsp. columellifera TaxID=706583 RepID=A0ABN3NIT7_9ACTN
MSDNRIVVSGLSKNFGSVRAVQDLSFTVEPGRVTGFLGPNGAGKTTTLRMILGLVRPTAGTATIGGQRYLDLHDPLRRVGALLDASAAHGGRTGRNHLRVLCAAAGLPRRRADETLELVGLVAAADRPIKGYSLGMRQRLGVAAAFLGEPPVLVFDEPANGLDPEGIHWLRQFVRSLAAAGRTVLVSSHLLAEMQLMADDVVIVAGGRTVRQGSVADVLASVTTSTVVHVRTPDADRLHRALADAGAAVARPGGDRLTVTGMSAAETGGVALRAGVELHELRPEAADLERAFLDLTAGKAEIR